MAGLAPAGNLTAMVAVPTTDGIKRVLLVACEYSQFSPQGLRWLKLSHALARLGWQIEVVTFEPHEAGAFARNPRIHGANPGPYRASVRWLQQRCSRLETRINHAGEGEDSACSERSVATARLNWKGQIDRLLQLLLGWWLYPDLRREGLPFLRSRVRHLLNCGGYAAVILSHEPPLSLEILDTAMEAGLPVIADLGDPVCTIYTPPRWQARAYRLERKVCNTAAAIVTTSRATMALLVQRHGELPPDSEVISQGFDPVAPQNAKIRTAPETRNSLRVVYTGRFYRFRDPSQVISAVQAVAGVTLALALPEFPDWLAGDWQQAACFEMHQRLSHAGAVELQRSADVLLVIGNDDPAQTPGKLFEYLAIDAPILYVARREVDPGAELVRELKRGIVVPSNVEAIAEALLLMRELHLCGNLASQFDLSPETVGPYSWDSLANRYSSLLARVVSKSAKK